MGYWRWLFKKIRSLNLKRQVKEILTDPWFEGIWGAILALGCSMILASLLDLPLWTGLLAGIILAFFLLTHGIYRDFGKDEE